MDPISEAIWPYFVSLFIGIILISIFLEKKRGAKLESLAKDLGFEFSTSTKNATLSEHANFNFLKKGRDRQISKEMWGAVDGNDFRIFVYRYREDGGNNRWCNKTVLVARCPLLHAPTCSLEPKSKRLMMMPDFSQYDIGFEISPILSQSYVIKGDDEVKVRKLFNPSVIKFFESNSSFYLETQQDTLLIYNSERRSGYCDVEKLFTQGKELVSKLNG